MVSELAEALSGQKLGNELYLGSNVQEEVGLRGAHTSTTKFDPEVFLAVDCSPAGDVYGGQGKIGDGTLIRFYDPGHLLLPGMKDFLLTTAEEAGIKYQYYWRSSSEKWWCPIYNNRCLRSLYPFSSNPLRYG